MTFCEAELLLLPFLLLHADFNSLAWLTKLSRRFGAFGSPCCTFDVFGTSVNRRVA